MSPTGDWVGIRFPSRTGTVRRALSTTTTSDDSIQWFDADDGPEEYVIEEPEVELEAETAERQVASDQESDFGMDEERCETLEPSEATEERIPIKRRTHLPAPLTGDEMSLLSVLRKNVGKASSISLLGLTTYRCHRICHRYLFQSDSMSPYRFFSDLLRTWNTRAS
jgi:hypothetical protein